MCTLTSRTFDRACSTVRSVEELRSVFEADRAEPAAGRGTGSAAGRHPAGSICVPDRWPATRRVEASPRPAREIRLVIRYNLRQKYVWRGAGHEGAPAFANIVAACRAEGHLRVTAVPGTAADRLLDAL